MLKDDLISEYIWVGECAKRLRGADSGPSEYGPKAGDVGVNVYQRLNIRHVVFWYFLCSTLLLHPQYTLSLGANKIRTLPGPYRWNLAMGSLNFRESQPSISEFHTQSNGEPPAILQIHPNIKEPLGHQVSRGIWFTYVLSVETTGFG